MDQGLASMIHHRWRTPDELARRYPSHLHINLLPRLQASGHGNQLTRTLLAALRDQGSLGVHLHTPRNNRRAVGFYRHFGFTELPAADAGLPGPGVRCFGMALPAGTA